MKYLVVVLIALSTIAWSNDCDMDFNDSYQSGYKDGSSYNPGGINYIPKIAPIPPLPKIGEDCNDRYIRGVFDGVNDRRKSRRGLGY